MAAINKNELRKKLEKVVDAFERYGETLEPEAYENFYEAINEVFDLCDGDERRKDL